MQYRIPAFLFILSLFVLAAAACFQATPGYMDAEYYFAGGQRLAAGKGFSEEFVWNYLGGEATLPAPGAPSLQHASHAYWMPLASLLSALGMWITGSISFRGAQMVFVITGALISPLTYVLARSILSEHLPPRDTQQVSLLAGLLAAFPGFYLAYLPTTDTFSIYMLLGGLWILAVGRRTSRYILLRLFGLGVIAGAMHLSRADGILWLVMGLSAATWLAWERGTTGKKAAAYLALVIAGYLLVFGPWMLRNYGEFGTLLSPGGTRALWLIEYDELYAYPASLLTPARWWASGMPAILSVRFDAFWANLQTTLAVQGLIFLFPLIILGAWQLRTDRRVLFAGVAWLVTTAVMSLAFPFAGARGGFFHSGAALQPVWWVLAAAGLESFVAWGSRHRGWHTRQAKRVFSAGLLVLALGMSLFLYHQRVMGEKGVTAPGWDEAHTRYGRLERALQVHEPLPEDIVVVNNPPGYYLAAGRQGAAIPYGGEAAVRAVAERLGARYLLLEIDQIQDSLLFTQPGDQPGLRYLETTADGVRIYEFSRQK